MWSKPGAPAFESMDSPGSETALWESPPLECFGVILQHWRILRPPAPGGLWGGWDAPVRSNSGPFQPPEDRLKLTLGAFSHSMAHSRTQWLGKASTHRAALTCSSYLPVSLGKNRILGFSSDILNRLSRRGSLGALFSQAPRWFLERTDLRNWAKFTIWFFLLSWHFWGGGVGCGRSVGQGYWRHRINVLSISGLWIKPFPGSLHFVLWWSIKWWCSSAWVWWSVCVHADLILCLTLLQRLNGA